MTYAIIHMLRHTCIFTENPATFRCHRVNLTTNLQEGDTGRMLASSSGIFSLIIDKALWCKTWLKLWHVWHSYLFSYFWWGGCKTKRATQWCSSLKASCPVLGGSWENATPVTDGGPSAWPSTNSGLCPQQPGFRWKFSGGEAWLETPSVKRTVC